MACMRSLVLGDGVSSIVKQKYPPKRIILQGMSRYNPRSMSFLKNTRQDNLKRHSQPRAATITNSSQPDHHPNSYIFFQTASFKQGLGMPPLSAQNQQHCQQSRCHVCSENGVRALNRRNQQQRLNQNRVQAIRERQSQTTVEPNRASSSSSEERNGKEQRVVYERDPLGNKYRVYGQSSLSYGNRTTFRKQNICETCCSCILATCCCCCGGAMLYGTTQIPSLR